ncbi:MAG: alpha/beta hydrolase, partial [Micrococcales bacterium]
MNLPFYQVDRKVAGSVKRPHIFKPGTNGRTLLLLHGTGADEHDLLGVGRLLDPNANLLSPRGLVVHQGMARHFLRHDSGEFDEAGIKANSDDLASFVWDAAHTYGFDPEQVWGAGFSNGATALNALLLQHPETLKGIFAFGTTRPFSNPEHVDLTGKYVFIANG